MKRRVVITGVGIVTAHGTGYEANLEGMRLGRDSIAAIRSFDVSAYRGKTACSVGFLTMAFQRKKTIFITRVFLNYRSR